MKRLLVAVTLTVFAYSAFAQQNYHIEGTTTLDSPITLYKLPDPSKKETKEIPGRSNAYTISDYKEKVTEVAPKDGKFEFLGIYTQPEIYSIAISIEEREKQELFVIDNNNISVDIDSNGNITVSGSTLSKLFSEYKENRSKLAKESSDLMKSMMASGEMSKLKDNPDLRDKLQASQQKIIDYSIEFAKNNINSVVGQYALGFVTATASVDQLSEIVAQANSETLNTPTLKKAVDRINAQNAINVGKPYINLELQNPNGGKAALADYVGKSKYVLVDFWATWCAPCKKEVPTFIEAYNEYKGFEIVGISLDEKKDDWLKSIAEWGMPWPQISDLGGFRGDAAQKYLVKAIPYTVLIGPDGNIVSIGLRGEDLKKKLQELLGK